MIDLLHKYRTCIRSYSKVFLSMQFYSSIFSNFLWTLLTYYMEILIRLKISLDSKVYLSFARLIAHFYCTVALCSECLFTCHECVRVEFLIKWMIHAASLTRLDAVQQQQHQQEQLWGRGRSHLIITERQIRQTSDATYAQRVCVRVCVRVGVCLRVSECL